MAHAQPVSPVTVAPSDISPEQRNSELSVSLPSGATLKPPKGAEKLSFDLAAIKVEGGFAELADEIGVITGPLAGKKVTVAQIYEAASQIERAHAKRGYILARVSVPPQQLKDGSVLRLVVTGGQIEEIDISSLPERVQKPVSQRLRALVGNPRTTLDEIEEALVIAGETPGLNLRSTIMRGSQPGGSKLVLEGDYQGLAGALRVDTDAHESLGGWGPLLQIAARSPFGGGEELYGFASADHSFKGWISNEPRNRTLGAGAIVPLSQGRVTLNPEVIFASTAPDAIPGFPRAQGKFKRLTLRSDYILGRSRHKRSTLSVTLEQISDTNLLPDFDYPVHKDRYMAARLGLEMSIVKQGPSHLSFAAQLSQGLGDLGSRSPADIIATRVPYSRQGAGNGFTKLELSGRWRWALDSKASWTVMGRAQTGFGQALYRAEQIALEGSEGLSAYSAGYTAVDSGAVLRGELARIVQPGRGYEPDSARIEPYLFGSVAVGRLARPTIVESKHISAFNYGAGTRVALKGGLYFSAEYARSLSDHRQLNMEDRFNLAIGLRF